ncbi:hypothetical protein NW754_007829 [Fusarium falciforme]|nr:hypothetical protein NW754_007829 [Fusarium falciforme]KAJ4238390.1 hypothetical protein NW757_013090 [Fusarium falciforme]
MALEISRVSFENHRSALGIAEAQPRVSWRFGGVASDWEQSAYDIEINRYGKSEVYSAVSAQSLYVPWPGPPLDETEPASVRVRAHGNETSTPWSDWVCVETGISNKTWSRAKPITSTHEFDKDKPKVPLYFRKDFDLSDDLISARLYITALGIYEAEINGKRVGDHVLAPGWQSYHHRHVYDTYNVTELLQPGHNAIGALVGEGWYAGRLGFGGGKRNIYGDVIGPLALLKVTLKNGTTQWVPTDDTWKSTTGPLVSAEIHDGEEYDGRLASALKGWSTASFDSDGWEGTRELPPLKGKLTAPDQPPVRVIQTIKPKSFFKSASGKTLVDFGQNLVGHLRVNVTGPRDTNITFHHAEVLENDELALRPLRQAAARDVLILSGDGPIQWEPKFTFHGFRYAQVDGWPEETPLDENSIVAVVVHTDLEETGFFECSNPLLNQFHSNVRWSMKGNFLSIPTDCPQRDERLGWTGDAHAFGPTANYLFDTAGFWKGWHKDIWSEMKGNRMIPPVYVPSVPTDFGGYLPTAIWGDVVVGNPWNTFTAFGDEALLAENLPQAQAWIDVGIPRNQDGLWDPKPFQFGDWLDPLSPADSPGNATTHSGLVADAYLVKMTEIMSHISHALGKRDLAKNYTRQHGDLREAFEATWVPDGDLANRTQTAYTLALDFGLLKDKKVRTNAAQSLIRKIKDNNYLVGTGFAATARLGFALKSIDSIPEFYRMLLQEKVPSWLYQVVQGGTTTWERWDSLLANGSVNSGTMTSFNHYAFGSVAGWMHQVVGGIAPAEPGYKKIIIAPVPGGGIDKAKARLISPYGEIVTDWRVKNSHFDLKVVVPPNTQAEIVLPGVKKNSRVVGSGYHKFRVENFILPQ